MSWFLFIVYGLAAYGAGNLFGRARVEKEKGAWLPHHRPRRSYNCCRQGHFNTALEERKFWRG